MKYNKLRKKLKRYGYTRKTDRLSKLSNKPVIKRNFADKSLNRTYLSNSPVTGTNFNNAAMTGSYFNNCQFNNCHMYMSDLEYCEFYKCFFTSKYAIVSSFNDSNFSESIFENVSFSNCAFSGSFFEKCTFKNVKIEFTTFENSLFKNCTFENMNMKILNLDFIEFEKPKMDNVILPLEQITHSIGLLEYCIYTTDNILIGSDSNVVLSKEEYCNQVIPLLEEEYIHSKEYFPLSNIYLAKKEYEKAYDTLHKGLCDAVTKRDFRILKFYCKLIKANHCFDSHVLHSFYHCICRLAPNPTITENNSLLRGYIRNIAEIKNILFDSTKKPTLHISLLTNLSSKQNGLIGKVISHLLEITKMNQFKMPNRAGIRVTENSPLLIEMDIVGEEKNIAYLFPILISLSNANCEVPLFGKCTLDTDTKEYAQLEKQAESFHSSCVEHGITLTWVEYYFENCSQIIPPNQSAFYYNSNLKQYRKQLQGV